MLIGVLYQKNTVPGGIRAQLQKYCSVRDVQQRVDRGSIQVVLMTYDLFSWKKRKKQSNQNKDACNHIYTNLTRSNGCSLCSRRYSSITPNLIVPPHSFSMLSPFLLGISCLSFPLSEGPGPPSHFPPTLTPFPSDPRQQPVSMLGTSITGYKSLKYTVSCCGYRTPKKKFIIEYSLMNTVPLVVG